jgi:hypothetical protein
LPLKIAPLRIDRGSDRVGQRACRRTIAYTLHEQRSEKELKNSDRDIKENLITINFEEVNMKNGRIVTQLKTLIVMG